MCYSGEQPLVGNEFGTNPNNGCERDYFLLSVTWLTPLIINTFSNSKLLTVDHYLHSNRSIILNESMKLYINIILKYFYFCNHSCDIHIFDVLYRLYKCSSVHVKTIRSPEFSNSRHCCRYHSSYMKDGRELWVCRHICFHYPPPHWISATTPLAKGQRSVVRRPDSDFFNLHKISH